MNAKLQKDDSFDLGPPRNARKWQQAKDYAASVGRAGDFPFLLQTFAMLDMLPAYKSLPRLRLDLGKANMGRKKPNGRRQGLWAWAREEAKRRGKPESYAVGIAHRVMGKSLVVDLASWTVPGSRLSQAGGWTPDLARMLEGRGAVPPPVPMVANYDEAVRDLPMPPERRRLLADKFRSAFKTGLGARTMSNALAAAIREHGGGLHPALAGKLAHRVMYLASKTSKSERPRLTLSKAFLSARRVSNAREKGV